MIEEWRNIPGYEGLYVVSNTGKVRSLITFKILKPNFYTSGYLFVNLYKDKKPKPMSIHRMVASAFLEYDLNGDSRRNVIDHIDNNKTNNLLTNLQITTNRINSIKDKLPKSGHSCIYGNCGKWLIRMRINGHKISLGTLKDISVAIKIRDEFLSEIEPLKLTIEEIKEKITYYKLKIKEYV